jgi:hypothetical protein
MVHSGGAGMDAAGPEKCNVGEIDIQFDRGVVRRFFYLLFGKLPT